MSINWQRIIDTNLSVNVSELSPQTLALLATCLSNFYSRGQFNVDGSDVTDVEWDEIEAALSLCSKELNETYICPPVGGATDYTEHAVFNLASDFTTYTIDDLDLLDGRDLLVRVTGAHTTGGDKHLRIQVNGLSTSIYNYANVRWDTATNYETTTQTYWNIVRALVADDTPQLRVAYTEIVIPDWKNDTRYPLLQASYSRIDRSGRSHCTVEEVTDVQSLTFFSSGGDLKAGTRITIDSVGT